MEEKSMSLLKGGLHQRLLFALLTLNIVSTVLHYIDNFISFDSYPQPTWITPSSIYISWLFLTAFAIAGYILYVKHYFWIAYLCLCIYSITGISSLGHYLYGSPYEMSWKMNAFILSDGCVGMVLLGFVIWSALIAKEWRFKVKQVS
jgi:hypothetical protein